MKWKEKIRAYVKRLQKPEGYGDYWKGYDSALNDILSFIDPLQEEPVDKCKGCNNVKGCITCVDGDQWAHYEEPVTPIWHNARKSVPENGQWILCLEEGGCPRLSNMGILTGTTKWAYVDDLVKAYKVEFM